MKKEATQVPTEEMFGQSHAERYDTQWEKLSPMRDGIHFHLRVTFRNLPEDANILCVGVGTGAELLMLARAFPKWTFTAVDPSAPMLEVCKTKLANEGFSSRCTFHSGYLATLESPEKFHAATAILVSQFLTRSEDRQDFFREIRKRLYPGAILISADITSPDTPDAYDRLIDAWAETLMYAGLSGEDAKNSTSRWGTDVGVLRAKEIESIIEASGFENPTLFYQTLFIRAWFSTAPDH